MYRSIFLWLNEAANLIARHLASAYPAEYPDDASALDNARRQLVRALFDGAVRAEGVWWTDPGAPHPSEPDPTPPDKWQPIEAGWWEHDRYEQYVEEHSYTGFEFLFGDPEGLSGIDPDHSGPVRYVHENTDLLDKIIVRWSDNSFDPVEFYISSWVYAKIRMYRSDIEKHFGIQEAELPATEPEPPTDDTPQMRREPPKRGRRPAEVRTAVHEWLDSQPEGACLCDRDYTVTAHCYCIEMMKPGDELALRKCIDTIRKQVKTWCDKHKPRKR